MNILTHHGANLGIVVGNAALDQGKLRFAELTRQHELMLSGIHLRYMEKPMNDSGALVEEITAMSADDYFAPERVAFTLSSAGPGG